MVIRALLIVGLSITATVSVLSPAAGATTPPEPVFGSPATLTPDGNAYTYTAIADLTGEGRPDLIGVMSSSNSYTIYVWAQQPDGSLASSPATYSGSDNIWAIRTADVNGDGATDLVLGGDHGVDVWLQSSGVLTGPTTIPTSTTVRSLSVADLGGSAKPDLVVDSGSTVEVFIQQAGGTFASPVVIGSGYCVATGDFNGDGSADIAVCPTSGTYVALYDQSGGVFPTTPDQVATTNVPIQLTVADLNGDHEDDLVVSWAVPGSDSSGGLQIFLQAGGVLHAHQTITVPWSNSNEFLQTAVADINGDGTPDIVALPMWPSLIGLDAFLQDQSGDFSIACTYPLWQSNGTVAVGDLDSDGSPDIAAGGAGTVDVFPSAASTPKGSSQLSLFGQNWTSPMGSPSMSGSLTFASGCLMPTQVQIQRENPDGTTTDVGSAPVNSMDGTFSFTDTSVPGPGYYAYSASWPGDALRTGSNSSTLSVDDPPVSPSISLTPSVTGTIKWGTHVAVGVQVNGVPGDPQVSLYRDQGGSLSFVSSGPASAGLDLQPATSDSVYYVTYQGSGWYSGARSYGLQWAVRPIVTGKMTGYARRQGSYAYYDSGQRVVYQSQIQPDLAGQVLRIGISAKTSSGWCFLGASNFRIASGGKVSIYFKPRALPAGIRFRLETDWHGSTEYASATSAPSYFEILRSGTASPATPPPAGAQAWAGVIRGIPRG